MRFSLSRLTPRLQFLARDAVFHAATLSHRRRGTSGTGDLWLWGEGGVLFLGFGVLFLEFRFTFLIFSLLIWSRGFFIFGSLSWSWVLYLNLVLGFLLDLRLSFVTLGFLSCFLVLFPSLGFLFISWILARGVEVSLMFSFTRLSVSRFNVSYQRMCKDGIHCAESVNICLGTILILGVIVIMIKRLSCNTFLEYHFCDFCFVPAFSYSIFVIPLFISYYLLLFSVHFAVIWLC